MNKIWSCLLPVVLLAGCGQQSAPVKSVPQLVDVAQVIQGDLVQPMLFSGVSRAAERADLAFQSSGVLSLRPVRIGDEVAAGDLLAALENPDLEPSKRAAEASLARLRTEQVQAQRNVNRLQELFVEGAVGEQSLEEEQTRLASLNDQIRQARAQLASDIGRVADSSLSAPFAGLIGQVNFEVGEYVRAGEAVLIIGGLDIMEVVLALPTAIWKDLYENQSVQVTVLGLNENYTGEVYDIGALADPATGLFPVVVRFPESVRSRSGQRVTVAFEQVTENAMQVPITAIVDPIGGAPKVYRLQSNTAYTIPVEVLAFAGQQVAIRAALEVDDLVITAGHMSLVDGQTVNVHKPPVAIAVPQQ